MLLTPPAAPQPCLLLTPPGLWDPGSSGSARSLPSTSAIARHLRPLITPSTGSPASLSPSRHHLRATLAGRADSEQTGCSTYQSNTCKSEPLSNYANTKGNRNYREPDQPHPLKWCKAASPGHSGPQPRGQRGPSPQHPAARLHLFLAPHHFPCSRSLCFSYQRRRTAFLLCRLGSPGFLAHAGQRVMARAVVQAARTTWALAGCASSSLSLPPKASVLKVKGPQIIR